MAPFVAEPGALFDEMFGDFRFEHYADEVVRVHADDYRSPALHDALARIAPATVLFTGGGIVPAPVFAIEGLRLVHVHTGLLPFVRGADVLLWSLLVRGRPGVSAFVMTPGLDDGDVLATWETDPLVVDLAGERPDDETLYRTVFSFVDPLLRAELLVRDVLVPDAWDPTPQDLARGDHVPLHAPDGARPRPGAALPLTARRGRGRPGRDGGPGALHALLREGVAGRAAAVRLRRDPDEAAPAARSGSATASATTPHSSRTRADSRSTAGSRTSSWARRASGTPTTTARGTGTSPRPSSASPACATPPAGSRRSGSGISYGTGPCSRSGPTPGSCRSRSRSLRRRVVAFEINPFLVEAGRLGAEYLGVTNVEFLVSSFEDFDDRGERFDDVLSFANHHTYDGNTHQGLEEYLARCHALLRPGGRLIFESHPPALEGRDFARTVELIGAHFVIERSEVHHYGTFLDQDRRFIVATRRDRAARTETGAGHGG